MRRWISIVILVLAILVVVAGGALVSIILNPRATPTPMANLIYLSDLSGTALEVAPPGEEVWQPNKGDMIQSKIGQTFSTTDTGYGHVHLGFPGQVDIYLASSTQILLKESADERTHTDLLLTHGWLIAKLPNTFPAGQRLVVENPEGARVWASGTEAGDQYIVATIGVQYLPAAGELYVDCLKGQCGYVDASGEHPLSEGSHVTLKGNTVLTTGPGIRSELWQFVSNMVSTPTPVPSQTPDVAATQACQLLLSMGQSCDTGFPTLTITPSPTLDIIATQECKRQQSLGTPCP